MRALAIGIEPAVGSAGALLLSRLSADTEIASVGTVGEATEALAGGGFDAALIAKELLDRDGLDVVSTLRGASPSVAVVLLGAAASGEHRAYSLRAGVDDTLAIDDSEHDPSATLRRAVLRRGRLVDRAARERTVLVVDDDPDVLDSVMEALRRASITAFAASEPLSGLECLARSLPAVVVTDLKMPGLSGSELVAAALRFDPEVVPIVITGYATLDNAVEALRAGAFDFLVKPLTPDQIVGSVHRAFTHALVGAQGRALLRSAGLAAHASIRVLLVEDSEGDEILLRDAVDRVARARFQITTARTVMEAVTCLGEASNPFDVVLLDMNLPDSSGLATFAEVHIKAPLVPIVVLTGVDDDVLAERVLLAGAQEYLVKGQSSGELIATRLVYAIDRMRLLEQLAGLARDVRASDASRRLLIERNADAMVVVGETEHVLFANEAAEPLLGRSRQSLIGERLAIPFVVDRGGGPGAEVEVEISPPDGSSRWVAVRTVETEWQGRLARLASIRDITDRKIAENLRVRLAHADRLIAAGQLAAGVAHEINNPAAFVLANLRMLDENEEKIGEGWARLHALAKERGDRDLTAIIERADITPIVRESREMISDNIQGIERIAKIVKDLRGFSRIEREEVRQVDLNTVVTSACNLVENEIRHRARLVKDLASVPFIAGDEGRLGQVVVNLLVNASQAIDAGAPEENEVRITTRNEEGKVRLTVMDTGRGMPPEQTRRIFEPFFTTKGMEHGMGLGLSITHEIVAKHGGTISVESVVGNGTIFTVVIPEETGLEVETRAAPVVPGKARKERARVLLVDDEPMLRKAFARMLRDHDVVPAEGGQEGLAILMKDQSFDVVLCDMMMPDLDGPALYDAIESAHPAMAKRFVFVTGGAFTPRAKDFLARVQAIVLEKPLTMELLVGVVGQFVGTGVGK